jgi:hypothetical protein
VFKSLAARSDECVSPTSLRGRWRSCHATHRCRDCPLRPLAFRLIDGAAARFEAVARPMESGADGLLGLLADGDVAAVAGFIRERLDATRRQLNRLAAMVRA